MKFGTGFWDVFLGPTNDKKMRLIDIRVNVFWNPFFQKCWGGFLVSANGLKTQKHFIFKLFYVFDQIISRTYRRKPPQHFWKNGFQKSSTLISINLKLSFFGPQKTSQSPVPNFFLKDSLSKPTFQ